MPEINYIIPLCLDFLWLNRYLMGTLTARERKLFFIVFVLLNPLKLYTTSTIITIPLSVIKVLIGSNSNEDHLADEIRKAYKKIAEGYAKNSPIPYTFLGIKDGCAHFYLKDTFVFSDQGGSNLHYCQIDLAEVFSAASGPNKDYHSAAIGWYFLSVVQRYFYDHRAAQADMNYPRCELIADNNGVPVKLMVTIGHDELKKITGYGLYDYTRFPGGVRERFLRIREGVPLKYKLYHQQKKLLREDLSKQERRNTEASIAYMMKDIEAMEQALGANIDDLEKEMHEILKTIQPLRQPFIDTVLTPGIEELNRGGMVNFDEMEAWKRPKKRTRKEIEAGMPVRKATRKNTFVRTNYEMKELKPGECVIKNPVFDKKGNMIGGVSITKNITNYRYCRVGNEHTLCINLQPGANYNREDLIRVFQFAVANALGEPEAEPLEEPRKRPHDVYLEDVRSITEDVSSDEEFIFNEEAYANDMKNATPVVSTTVPDCFTEVEGTQQVNLAETLTAQPTEGDCLLDEQFEQRQITFDMLEAE